MVSGCELELVTDSCFRMVARGVGAEDSGMALGDAGDVGVAGGFSFFHDCAVSLFAMNLKRNILKNLFACNALENL